LKEVSYQINLKEETPIVEDGGSAAPKDPKKAPKTDPKKMEEITDTRPRLV
jgi:hypothetical protein